MRFRNLLLQIHLWVGLIAGIFFVLLGLSGSALVYPTLFQSAPSIPKASDQGTPLPLEQVIAAARDSAPQSEGRTATVTLPRSPGDAVTVQFNGQQGGRGEAGGGRRRGGRRGRPRAGGDQPPGANGARDAQNGERGGAPEDRRDGGRGGAAAMQIFVDPVSGKVLGTGITHISPLVGVAHQMHESMLLGGPGRTFVAWLGVGMLFLGLSGLYLWWPKNGQWKFAFGVRRTARGFRLYREIHGMLGIWFWVVFLFVTVTALPLGFPSVMRLVTAQPVRGEGPGAPGQPGPGQAGRGNGFGQPQIVETPDGATALPLSSLIADAEKASGSKALGIIVPAQPDRAVSVNVASGDGDRPRSIAVNPYTGAVLQSAGPRPGDSGFNRGSIEQLHGGGRLGPVWQFLVFLSGFLPMIFVVTGFMMWLKKRQNRRAAGQA